MTRLGTFSISVIWMEPPSSKILVKFFSCIMLVHPTYKQSLQSRYPCSWFVIVDDDDNDGDNTNTLFQAFHEVGTWSLVVSVQQDVRVKRVPPRLSSKHDWKWFLSAQVRSLSVLVTHCLTYWLRMLRLDWCDTSLWRCQLETCWSCYCCWFWW